jgi:hypothetical protein
VKIESDLEAAMASLKADDEFVDPEDWQKFTKFLSETNRFILSDYWENFIRIVVETSRKRAKTLKKGIRLARARIGTSWVKFEDGDEQPCPISPHEMGPPPKHLAKEGRLNSEGIPYLYLATNVETAVTEVRPWIGSELTIGTFDILEDLRIVDTSNDKPKDRLSQYVLEKHNDNDFDVKKRSIESYSPVEKEEYVWGDINSAFSKPVSPSDTLLKYLPTQYLSERFKTNGYDGIAYKSSLSQKGHNIALFNPNKAKCVRCRMFEIKQLKYKFEESGNPVSLSDDGKLLYPRIEFIGPVDTQNHPKKSD